MRRFILPLLACFTLVGCGEVRTPVPGKVTITKVNGVFASVVFDPPHVEVQSAGTTGSNYLPQTLTTQQEVRDLIDNLESIVKDLKVTQEIVPGVQK